MAPLLGGNKFSHLGGTLVISQPGADGEPGRNISNCYTVQEVEQRFFYGCTYYFAGILELQNNLFQESFHIAINLNCSFSLVA